MQIGQHGSSGAKRGHERGWPSPLWEGVRRQGWRAAPGHLGAATATATRARPVRPQSTGQTKQTEPDSKLTVDSSNKRNALQSLWHSFNPSLISLIIASEDDNWADSCEARGAARRASGGEGGGGAGGGVSQQATAGGTGEERARALSLARTLRPDSRTISRLTGGNVEQDMV